MTFVESNDSAGLTRSAGGGSEPPPPPQDPPREPWDDPDHDPSRAIKVAKMLCEITSVDGEDLIFTGPMEVRRTRWSTGSKLEREAIERELRALDAVIHRDIRESSPDLWAALADEIFTLHRRGRLEFPVTLNRVGDGEQVWCPGPSYFDALKAAAAESNLLDIDLVAAALITMRMESEHKVAVVRLQELAGDLGISEQRIAAALAQLRTTKSFELAREDEDLSLWLWHPQSWDLDKEALMEMVRKEWGISSPGIGHNSLGIDIDAESAAEQERPNALDPGPDAAFSMARSPLIYPDHIPEADRVRFEKALAAQGDDAVRFSALTQAAYRARDALKPHAQWKLYSIVSDHAKGQMRCCVLGFDYIAEHGGFGDRAQVSKLVKELEARGLIAALRFEVTDGNSRSRMFLAPTVTAADRMKASITDAMADIRKRVEEKRAKEAERLRAHRASKKGQQQEGDE